MIIGKFTVEEINLIAMCLGEAQTDTIMRVANMTAHMDTEMKAIAHSAIRKLAIMEEQEFAESSFLPADETEE